MCNRYFTVEDGIELSPEPVGTVSRKMLNRPSGNRVGGRSDGVTADVERRSVVGVRQRHLTVTTTRAVAAAASRRNR